MRRKGIYNRYSFIKRMNRNSIILIRGNKKYISFDRDLDILRYINFNMEYSYSSLKYLDKYNINYIVVDNLDVVVSKEFCSNNYMKYVKLMYLKRILLNIGNNLGN